MLGEGKILGLMPPLLAHMDKQKDSEFSEIISMIKSEEYPGKHYRYADRYFDCLPGNK
jgi:hypothetical protein